jgi:LPS sulfotransferase NodH
MVELGRPPKGGVVGPPADWVRPSRTLVIASTARSGSSWLGHLVSMTEHLGRSREYLGHWGDKRADAEGVAAALRRMRAEGTTPNDVTGVKVFPRHLAMVARFTAFSAWYPGARYVHIVRRDLLAQAISLQKARSSGRFYTQMPELRPPTYDAKRIAGYIARLALDNASWSAHFARTGIAPLTIAYEDAVPDPVAAVKAIAAHVGVEVPDAAIRAEGYVRKLSDPLSDEWRRRFLAEQGDPDRFEQVHDAGETSRAPLVARLLRRPAMISA